MGKKSRADRRLDSMAGQIAPPESAVPNNDDTDPMKVLSNIKKQQLLEYYSEKFGLSRFMLEQLWTYLEKANPKKLKALKRGEVKSIFKRQEYKDGELIIQGRVLDEEGNEIVNGDTVVIERAESPTVETAE